MIGETQRVSHAAVGGGEDLRLLVVGASTTTVCGVRDYARIVGDALRDTGAEVEFVWWERDVERPLSRTVAEQGAWLDRVAGVVETFRPDWIIWHYSVFAWATHGVPHLVPGAARRLGRLGIPILLVAHELAFPFGRQGWRGAFWAMSQRLALVWPVRASTAVVVTTGDRLRWLESRRWLPERPGRFLPVCSNLPGAESEPSDRLVAGIVGYGTERALASETMRALERLRAEGIDVDVLLLGAPGGDGVDADRWREAARRTGMADRLDFTGVLPAQELGSALAGTDVVILPDPGGPSSRRGVVAAALALGRPTVAVDGPEKWQELVECRALSIAPPSSGGIAEALRSLLQSENTRRAMANRAAEFYARRMAPDVLASDLRGLLAPSGGAEIHRRKADIAT